MTRCQKIRKKKRGYCVGDLRDEITIQNRSIIAPLSDVDFEEEFEDDGKRMSAINTVSGKTFFDNTGIETNITHEIGVRFDESITAESWVLFEDRRLDILNVENLDERSLWMRLQCTDRGKTTASKI